MLNPQRSGGDRANDETFQRFRDAGINVAWSSPKFYVTHEKSIVADGQAALVATFNLCHQVLHADPRLRRRHRRSAPRRADRRGVRGRLGASRLAPAATRGCCGATRIRAITWRSSSTPPRHRLDIQHPKYVDAVDPGPHRRRRRARRQGARAVRRYGTASATGTCWTPSPHCARLRRFGVKVHKQKNLRVHAKLLIVDDTPCARRVR